ncbi:unnamed protein product, partial [Mesorhabditis spiculigera]
MVHYKLHYFDLYGRAEPARMMFHMAGQEFEDRRYSFEDWPAIKKAETPSTFLFGQGPVLEVDGKKIAQSGAISRFVGNTFGFAGKDFLELAQIDMFVDRLADFFQQIAEWYIVRVGYKEGDVEELRKTLLDEHKKGFLGDLERQLKANGTGFLVGDKVSFGDLVLLNNFDVFTRLSPTYLDGYDEVKSYEKRLRELPKLKEYLESRPPSLQ